MRLPHSAGRDRAQTASRRGRAHRCARASRGKSVGGWRTATELPDDAQSIAPTCGCRDVTNQIGQASDAQIRANRANAALSTGPRSEEGKARVARNALVHGGCAGMLLPDEDQDAFHTLRSTYEQQYCPADETEHFLVGRLALAAWRLQSLSRM